MPSNNEFEFQDACSACGEKNDTVWEVVQGIALCESDQEAWFQSRMPVTRWLAKRSRIKDGENADA